MERIEKAFAIISAACIPLVMCLMWREFWLVNPILTGVALMWGWLELGRVLRSILGGE